MHELIEFLSQPLAMDLIHARSFVASIREQNTQREAIVRPQPYLLAESTEHADGFGPPMEMTGLDTIGSGSKLTAIVPLTGVLSMHGGYFTTSTAAFASTIQKLDANESVATIIVLVNSPGGTVTGTMEAANTLRMVRDAGQTKTIAFVEPMMASAATWIGTAAGECVITPSGEAGSIGVISMYEDWSQALEKMGIKVEIARTPGKKARFSGIEPMSEEMRETMLARNVAAYDQFIGAMAKNRNVPKSQIEKRFGGGEMMSAEEARESGLVDRIATFGELLAGIGKPGRPKGGRRAEGAELEQVASEESAAEMLKTVDDELLVRDYGDGLAAEQQETEEQVSQRRADAAAARRAKLESLGV